MPLITHTGDWMVVGIHFLRQFGYMERHPAGANATPNVTVSTEAAAAWSLASAVAVDWSKFQHFWYFAFTTAIGSYAIYFAIGGFLHVSVLNY